MAFKNGDLFAEVCQTYARTYSRKTSADYKDIKMHSFPE